MIQKPRCSQRSGCFRTSLRPKNSKDHAVHRRRKKRERKLACFLGKLGHAVTIHLEDRWTVTFDWHVHHGPTKDFEVWCQRLPQTGPRGLFLHYDNAIAHAAATTVDFLNESEVQLLPHPLYSPDLSPCCFLFPEVQKQLKSTLLQSVEDACLTFTRAVKTYPNQPGLKSGTKNGFTEWQSA